MRRVDTKKLITPAKNRYITTDDYIWKAHFQAGVRVDLGSLSAANEVNYFFRGIEHPRKWV